MITNNKIGDEVIVEGESNIRQATISKEKMGKLQYILTKALYSDPVSSTIVESTNNGVDGLVQSGKDFLENPVIVEIGTHRNGTHFFRVSDKGIGMSKELFQEVLMNYLESTKEETNELIGSWGLGSKAFLSLDRAGTFICRKDGVEVKFLVYQGAEFAEYDMLYEKETLEENGVIFEVEIIDRWEKQDFIQKATKKLAYYDTVVLLIDEAPIKNTIFRQEDFQWSDNANMQEMHIALKDVFYEINWTKLGIPRISLPVALRFNLDSGLQVTPPRDSLIYDKKAAEIIKKKIADAANWFGEKYNETVEGFDNFFKAFGHLGNNNKYVEIEGKKMFINELQPYMSIQLNDIVVKGIEGPRQTYISIDGLCANFKAIGNTTYNGTYSSKGDYYFASIKYFMQWGKRMVLLDQHPVGRVRDFLKKKFKGETYFMVEQKPSLELYKSLLNLDWTKKGEWREKIKEVQELHRQFREYVTFLKEIRESEEFITFETEQKALAKANKNTVGGVYKTLDKQEGEVTISYAREALLGNDCVFEKNTYKIEEMYKDGYVTLLFNEENKEEARNYYGLHKNLKVALIGKRERTKLPETHQIMEKEKFEKTKLFKRIVTAIRIEDVLDRWDKITEYREDILKDCLKKVSRTKNKLRDYKDENFVRMNLSREAKESFMALAHEHNLWDMEILHKIVKIEKALDTFYFLQYIEYPRYGIEEDRNRVKKIINQLLIYQKKHGALDNYELTEKPLPVEQLEEQLKIEEEFLNTPEAEMCMA